MTGRDRLERRRLPEAALDGVVLAFALGTASRNRRGPEGPNISQFAPLGKYSSGNVSLNSE